MRFLAQRRRTTAMTLQSSFVAVAVLALTANIQAQAPGARSPEKIQRAKEAAAHFLNRFNETLDFGVPYREMYISEYVSKGEPPPAAEEARLGADFEIAMMNLWYLRLAYFLTHDVHDLPPDIKAAGGDEFMPGISEPESPQGRRARQKDPDRWLKIYLKRAKKLADLYRRYLTPEMFSSSAYHAKMNVVKDSVTVEKSYGYAAFENQDVYKVEHGGIEYWLVEVNSVFKVIHINPLPGFRFSP